MEDLNSKTYDWITIDDGHKSCLTVSKMIKDRNIRAKFFISTSRIGMENHCTWRDIRSIAEFHDIENHGHDHVNLTLLPYSEIETNITTANNMIRDRIGRVPRYFVPPYNKWDSRVKDICGKLNLILVSNRIDILNTTP